MCLDETQGHTFSLQLALQRKRAVPTFHARRNGKRDGPTFHARWNGKRDVPTFHARWNEEEMAHYFTHAGMEKRRPTVLREKWRGGFGDVFYALY